MSAATINVAVAAKHAALPEALQHVHVLAHLLGRELHRSTIVGRLDELPIGDTSHDLQIDRVVRVKLADGIIQAVNSLVFNVHRVVGITVFFD